MLSCCRQHSINPGWSDQGYFNQSHNLANGGDEHVVNNSRWSLAAGHTAKTVTGNERFIENSLAGINRRMLISNSKCEGAGNNQKI